MRKFIDGVKLGAAIYVGWTIVEAIDTWLAKSAFGKKTISKLENIAKDLNEPEFEDEESTVIGFHPNN